MKKRPTLFLVDASSFIFRAFFAIRRLSNSKGMPTNAIYGFTTMLLKAIEQHQPDYIACVFDTAKPTFRKERYPEYKANRGAPPDDLIPQFEHIHRVVAALGLKDLSMEGFEADDIIATLTKRFGECEILIVTGDKDLMQLVDGHVKILDTMKDVIYDAAGVKEKLGVAPKHVTDFLGLTGDSSDNIPGVPGIGPKTAVELIDEYGDLEKILASTSKMKPSKRRESLENNAADARLSKELATVHCEVSGEARTVKLDELKAPEGVRPEFLKFLEEMEFKTLYKKYSGEESPAPAGEAQGSLGGTTSVAGALKEELVGSERALTEALEVLSKGKAPVALKVEQGDLWLHAKSGPAYRIALKNVGAEAAGAALLKLGQSQTLVAHDFKLELEALLDAGLEKTPRFLELPVFDTMLVHYLIDSEEKHEFPLLCERYLARAPGSLLKDLLELEKALSEELHKLGQEKLYREIEAPVAVVLADMEHTGIHVDAKILDKLSVEYTKELEEIEKEIFEIVGSTFNLNSPKQLGEILFTKLQLPVVQKTKTGYSTDISVLEKLEPMHPVPALVVRYRELNKLKNTYVDVLPGLIRADGRVHARFNQAVAATGRLSGSDPNLQNIPIKTESGRKIRRAFAAEKGCKFVGADYSQIELRLVAHMSGDKALIEAFCEDADVHRRTAAEIFHVKVADVTDRQRAAAKAINFGLIYGKSAFGLAQELGIPRHEAQAYIDAYFQRYSGVKAFMDGAIASARKEKVARTMFGRIRHMRDMDSRNVALRNNTERMAMNAPVQGTAADIMKVAMIQAYTACEKIGARMVLQVHDELVFEVAEGRAEQTRAALVKAMESAADLAVPLKVESAVASNWMEL